MKIDRSYRNSTAPAPFLQMEGDMPAAAVLVVDPQAAEVYITIPPTWAETPAGLKTFPWHPCLTVRGIDQVLERQDIQEALSGVVQGNENDEEYLLELLGNEDFWQHLDAVEPMEPWEYFETHPPRLQEGESLRDAARRIVSEALLERVVLDPLLTEMDLEEATWN
jgi:hypothetical protein